MVDAKALTERAKVLRTEGRLEEAVLAARSAVAADAENANAWWQLALTQKALRNIEEERQALLKLIELSPEFAYGLSSYGNLLVAEGRLAEASVQFELALLEDSDHLAGLRGMLHVLKPSKNAKFITRRLQLLQQLRDLGEADDAELFSLAFHYGQQDDAIASAHIYEGLPGLLTRPAALQNLSVMYRKLQRGADAMDAIRLSHSLDSSSTTVTRLMGEIAEERRLLREEVRKQTDPYLEQADWYRHYVNPFSLLDLPPEQATESVKALQKARQGVLRELELEENSVDWMPGLHLDRSSALALFEELNDAKRFAAHAHVYRNPALNAFLSTGSLKYFTQDTPDLDDVLVQATVPPERVEPLGLKFAAQFAEVLTKAIERHDAQALRALISGRRWVLAEHSEICFEGATRSLLRMSEELDNLREQAKTTPVKPEKVKELFQRSPLAKLLPWLPLDFHKVHEHVYQILSGISVAHYKQSGNAEEALALLELSKVSADKSASLRHEYENGITTLQGFIDEELKDAATLNFGATPFTINKQGVTQGAKFIPAAKVHAFRWGMTQTRAQPRAWQLSISFGDDDGQELGVSWTAEEAGFEAQRTHWGSLVDAAVAYILSHALRNFKKKLSARAEIPMGDVIVFEQGVKFTIKGFIFSREHISPWANIATSMANGDVILRDLREPKALARVPIATTNNALLLRMLTPNKET